MGLQSNKAGIIGTNRFIRVQKRKKGEIRMDWSLVFVIASLLLMAYFVYLAIAD
ncbi:hypothetical protein [Cytobacillus oceanisediminis]|uniref:hypothetical protein n=1 Tax=Cytobacillus oceanisediminis TaxID=665099 RepID=UPI0015E83ADD|nr:hypothetical protein [Cytobacillus oceanisediminis]